VKGWRLQGLSQVRDAESRVAAIAAARARARVREVAEEARALEARASELRCAAAGRDEVGAGPRSEEGCASSELAAWAGLRGRADGEARQASSESGRAAVRVSRAEDRAGRAAAAARAARERSDALARGAARWAAAARAAREVAQEREVEESWRPGASRPPPR
jgi:hypothetical protein